MCFSVKALSVLCVVLALSGSLLLWLSSPSGYGPGLYANKDELRSL